MKSQAEARSKFCPILSCFRLNNSKNFLAISRAGFGRFSWKGAFAEGHGDARGGDGVNRFIPSDGAVDVA
jgi:hypothetical protein